MRASANEAQTSFADSLVPHPNAASNRGYRRSACRHGVDRAASEMRPRRVSRTRQEMENEVVVLSGTMNRPTVNTKGTKRGQEGAVSTKYLMIPVGSLP